MPEWGKEDFKEFYFSFGEKWGRPGGRPPIMLHYHWFPILRWQRINYAPRLFNLLNMTSGMNVALVGCGFNGTGAGLEDLGVNVVGVDTSSYIDTEKVNTEENEIREAVIAAGLDPDVDLVRGPNGVDVDPLDLWLEGGRANPQARGKGQIIAEDMRNRGSRNQVKAALAADPRYAITEEVLDSITDSEAIQLCEYMEDLRRETTNCDIVHMLSPEQPDRPGSQSPKLNWKTYAGWRSFLDANGFFNHLILPTVEATGQGVALPDLNGFVQHYLRRGATFENAQVMANNAIAKQTVLAYSRVF